MATRLRRPEVCSNAGSRSWFEPLHADRIHAADADLLRLRIQHFARWNYSSALAVQWP